MSFVSIRSSPSVRDVSPARSSSPHVFDKTCGEEAEGQVGTPKEARVSAGFSSLFLLAIARLSLSLRVESGARTSNWMLDASQVETSASSKSRDVGGGIRREQNNKHAFLDLSSSPLLSSSLLSSYSSFSSPSSSASSSASPSSSSYSNGTYL